MGMADGSRVTAAPVQPVKRVAELALPFGAGPLSDRHLKYLAQRGFDGQKLAAQWGLLGTKHLGDYAFRIICPIFDEAKMVSYHSRDVSGQSDLRWKACEDSKEVIHYKDLLYGEWLLPPDTETVVVVEGIADVWRLGVGAVSTFGTGYTVAQVNRLRQYERVVVLYDNDEGGQRGARELVNHLSAYRLQIEIANLPAEFKDAGEITDADAQDVMKQLLEWAQ